MSVFLESNPFTLSLPVEKVSIHMSASACEWLLVSISGDPDDFVVTVLENKLC